MSLETSREQLARERRLRRAAERQGIAVAKSKRRDPRALDFGTWDLDDARRGRQLSGLTLPDVEFYLDHGELPRE